MDSQKSKEPEVAAQLLLLENKIDNLHDVLGKMQERLTSVLRAEPDTDTAKAQDLNVLVPLAASIRDYALRIGIATDRVNDIVRCLEL